MPASPKALGDRLLVQFLQRLAEHPHLFGRAEVVDHPVAGERLPLLPDQAGTVSTPISNRIWYRRWPSRIS